jgi:siroheme synthase-like protein
VIIDYDFRGKRVTIVGGGHETARKVRLFHDAGATVRLLGPMFDREALRVARELRIRVVRCPSSELGRCAFASAEVVAVVSDDPGLGARLRPIASRRRVLFYVGDDPESSDWAQPAIRQAGPITLALSTKGASPIVARTLANRLVRSIRPEDGLAVAVQAYARGLARRIPTPEARRRALYAVHDDPGVRSALGRGDLRRAKVLAKALVSEAVEAMRRPPRAARPR